MDLIKETIDSKLTFKQKILVASILQSTELNLNDIKVDSADLVESLLFIVYKSNIHVKFYPNYIKIYGEELKNFRVAPNELIKKPLLFSLKAEANFVNQNQLLMNITILYIDNNINIFNNINIINIIYNNIYNTGISRSAPEEIPKYLNLLNLGGLASQFDISSIVSLQDCNYNKIKYLDKLAQLNKKLAYKPTKIIKLTTLNLEVDSKDSIKENLSKHKSSDKSKLSSRDIVIYLKSKIEKHRLSIGGVAYFSANFMKDNIIITNSIMKKLTGEVIIESIDWFFNDVFWMDKIDSMKMIEKHINKFMAIRNKNVSSGILTKKIQKLNF